MTRRTLALLLVAALAAPALADALSTRARLISGHAEVIDGDTIRIRDRRIRLAMIDSPESDQRCLDGHGRSYNCGMLAASALEAEIAGRRVACIALNLDRHGRTVATCSINGKDLGEIMVRRGHAIEFKRYSDGRYAAAEEEARLASRGLWQGVFLPPEMWRRERGR